LFRLISVSHGERGLVPQEEPMPARRIALPIGCALSLPVLVPAGLWARPAVPVALFC
jgi:hypothetical protein